MAVNSCISKLKSKEGDESVKEKVLCCRIVSREGFKHAVSEIKRAVNIIITTKNNREGSVTRDAERLRTAS